MCNEKASGKSRSNEAIKVMKNRRPAGLDDILHDVWKKLANKGEKSDAHKEENLGFNIVKAFIIVFNDIY